MARFEALTLLDEEITEIAKSCETKTTVVRKLLAMGVKPERITDIIELRETHSPILDSRGRIIDYGKAGELERIGERTRRDFVSYETLGRLYRRVDGDIDSMDVVLEILVDEIRNRFGEGPIGQGYLTADLDSALLMKGMISRMVNGDYYQQEEAE